jgi:hypothetical protein
MTPLGMTAEAAFNLDHVYEPIKGLNFLPDMPTVTGLRTQPPPRYEPLRASGTRSGPSVRIVEPKGDLPPWSVIMCESKGSYAAENPHTTASGRYQFVDGTWNGYGGYSHASDAPPEVQDAKARQVWANGAGRGHWRQCL